VASGVVAMTLVEVYIVGAKPLQRGGIDLLMDLIADSPRSVGVIGKVLRWAKKYRNDRSTL